MFLLLFWCLFLFWLLFSVTIPINIEIIHKFINKLLIKRPPHTNILLDQAHLPHDTNHTAHKPQHEHQIILTLYNRGIARVQKIPQFMNEVYVQRSWCIIIGNKILFRLLLLLVEIKIRRRQRVQNETHQLDELELVLFWVILLNGDDHIQRCNVIDVAIEIIIIYYLWVVTIFITAHN